MPDALWFTDDPKACELLARDPFALLVGFALDQQVPVQKAFAAPYLLEQRVGTLDPSALATMDLEAAFTAKPALHRFPGAMARRVQALAADVAGSYGGDASRLWREAKDGRDLRERITALPGFGDMKIKALGSVLAKQYGIEAAKELVPNHPTLGDVTSPEELERYQAAKRAHKRSLKTA